MSKGKKTLERYYKEKLSSPLDVAEAMCRSCRNRERKEVCGCPKCKERSQFQPRGGLKMHEIAFQLMSNKK